MSVCAGCGHPSFGTLCETCLGRCEGTDIYTAKTETTLKRLGRLSTAVITETIKNGDVYRRTFLVKCYEWPWSTTPSARHTCDAYDEAYGVARYYLETGE